jgi:hypothetical protein
MRFEEKLSQMPMQIPHREHMPSSMTGVPLSSKEMACLGHTTAHRLHVSPVKRVHGSRKKRMRSVSRASSVLVSTSVGFAMDYAP